MAKHRLHTERNVVGSRASGMARKIKQCLPGPSAFRYTKWHTHSEIYGRMYQPQFGLDLCFVFNSNIPSALRASQSQRLVFSNIREATKTSIGQIRVDRWQNPLTCALAGSRLHGFGLLSRGTGRGGCCGWLCGIAGAVTSLRGRSEPWSIKRVAQETKLEVRKK